MLAEKSVAGLKDTMRLLADPDSNYAPEERAQGVIEVMETLQLSSYTHATFPLSDADAADLIGNAAVAICQLTLFVHPLDDAYPPLQARVAGSGELLRSVLHRGMGHPATASLYPSGAQWMSGEVTGWVSAKWFDGEEVQPSRCCGMLCAQMLGMLGAGFRFRRAETVEAVRRDIPAAALEWMLAVGTEWRWAYPMRFIQQLCNPLREAPQADSGREAFIALLRRTPAVEEACDAAAAAVKQLLDSARISSEVFVCYAQLMFELRRDLRDGSSPDAPLSPAVLQATEVIADAVDQVAARIGSLARARADQRPLHLRNQQPGDAGGVPSPSRAERKADKKAARKEAKKEVRRDGYRRYAAKVQLLDLPVLVKELYWPISSLSSAGASPEMVVALCKGGRLVAWMGDKLWHPEQHIWSVYTGLVAGVLEVAIGGGTCSGEALQLLRELVASFDDTTRNTSLLLKLASKSDTEVLLEVLDWLPQPAGQWQSIPPLCVVASRVYQGQEAHSQVKDINHHDAIVSSALQRIISAFHARPTDEVEGQLFWAPAALAACSALDNYKANRKLHPDGFPHPSNSAYHALHLLSELALSSPTSAATHLPLLQPHIVFHATIGGAFNDLAAFCLAAQLHFVIDSTSAQRSEQRPASRPLLRALTAPHLLQQLLKRYAWQCDNRVPDGESLQQHPLWKGFSPWWARSFEPLLLFLVGELLDSSLSWEGVSLSTRSIQVLLQAAPFWKALSARLLPPDDPLAAPLPMVPAGHPLQPLVARCRHSAREVLERAVCIVNVPGFTPGGPEEGAHQSRLRAMQLAVDWYDADPTPQGVRGILERLARAAGEHEGEAALGREARGEVAPGSLMAALHYVHDKVEGVQKAAGAGGSPAGAVWLHCTSTCRAYQAARGCEAAPSIQRGPSEAAASAAVAASSAEAAASAAVAASSAEAAAAAAVGASSAEAAASAAVGASSAEAAAAAAVGASSSDAAVAAAVGASSSDAEAAAAPSITDAVSTTETGDAAGALSIAKLQADAGLVASRVFQVVTGVAAGLACGGRSRGGSEGASCFESAGDDADAVGGGAHEGCGAMDGRTGVPEPGKEITNATATTTGTSSSRVTDLHGTATSGHMQATPMEVPLEFWIGLFVDSTLLPVLLQHQGYLGAAMRSARSAEAQHDEPLPLPLPLLPVVTSCVAALLPGGAAEQLASSEVQQEAQALLQRLRAVERRAAGPRCSECAELLQEVPMMCSGCRQARYCNRECQRAHWRAHRKQCRQWQQLAPAVAAGS